MLRDRCDQPGCNKAKLDGFDGCAQHVLRCGECHEPAVLLTGYRFKIGGKLRLNVGCDICGVTRIEEPDWWTKRKKRRRRKPRGFY